VASAPQISHPAKPRSTQPIPFPAPRRGPLELWHLLSLDAPTVAALWTFFLARANHIALPATSIAAMGVAVWLLYAADRLLDARLLDSSNTTHQPLEARHRFHHQHRQAFLIGIAIAAAVLAALLPTLAPAAIRLYLIEASFLAGYFILIHATRSAHRLPKELAVGLFFSAATFIPTISRDPALRLPLLIPAILFSLLCTLNCLFIYAWEHPSSIPDTHPATRIALQHLHTIGIALLIAALAACAFHHQIPWPILAAIATATLVLLLLDHYRRKLPTTTLRAAADLALLTPILFLIR
jgi:hypothetical protein